MSNDDPTADRADGPSSAAEPGGAAPGAASGTSIIARLARTLLVAIVGVVVIGGVYWWNIQDALSSKRRGRPVAKLEDLGHPWPPEHGEPYPDLDLIDPVTGEDFRLSSLAGKVLVVHFIGMTSPGSLGLVGGADASFGSVGGDPIPPIEVLLESADIPPGHPDLLIVHVLVFGKAKPHAAPTREEANEFIAHFGLADRPSTTTLLGRERHTIPHIRGVIPGFHVIDRDFRLADANWMRGIATAARLLRSGPRVEMTAPEVPALPPEEEGPRPIDHLRAHDWEKLDAAMTTIDARGRVEGDWVTHLEIARESLLAEPDARAHLDAWCEGAPESAWPFLIRGADHIDAAWEARGSGWARTVGEDGWRLFGEHLVAAKADLEKAHALAPTLADAPALLVTVAMGLGPDRVNVEEYLTWATEADPHHMTIHGRMLNLLLPRWHGSAEAAFGYARGAVGAYPDEPAMWSLVLTAHRMVYSNRQQIQIHLAQPGIRDEIARAIDELLAGYPGSARAHRAAERAAGLLGDDEKAQVYLERAAELGDAGAIRRLGDQLLDLGEVEQAIERYVRSAELGSATSCLQIGDLFLDGERVTGDEAAAVAWFRRGAELGQKDAMTKLGWCHEHGKGGLAPDLATAVTWYRNAARLGQKWAAGRLLELLEKHPELRQPGDPE